MSKIGDYVHYYARNYNKYGTNKYGEGAYVAYNFESQKSKLKEKIENNNSKMSPQERENMQKSLSYILSNNTGRQWDNNVAQIQDTVKQKMEQDFGSRLGTIDFDTGNITVESIVDKRNKALTYIQTNANQKRIRLNTIMSRINEIEKMYENITSPTNKKKIQDSINQIKATLAELCQTSEQDLKELSDMNISLEYNMETSTLVQDLNEIIKTMGVTPPISLEKGDLLEYIIAFSGGVAKGIVYNEIEGTFKQAVGKNRGDVIINLDKFTDEFDPSVAGLNVVVDNNGSKFSVTGNSQGKVDVKFDLGNGNTTNISAKNVNLSSGYNVHIVSGTSLLYLIQDESPDFVNHYLNLCAAHPEDESNINLAQMMEAQQTMKMTVIWKALSGDVYGRNSSTQADVSTISDNDNSQADTFIINDNSSTSKNSVKVYDIATLAEKIIDNIDDYASVTANKGDLNTVAFRNDWASTYTERISNLLADVHAQKISVTLAPSSFST